MTARLRITESGRPIAAGGWRRALIGLVVGAAAGAMALVTLKPDRDD